MIDALESRPSVLLASADPQVQQDVQAVVASQDLPLTMTSSGGDALLLVLTKEVALAVVDLVLDDLPGAKTIALIKQCRPRLPLLVVASQDSPEAEVRGLGVFYYLTKPLDREEFREAVSSALRPRALAPR